MIAGPWLGWKGDTIFMLCEQLLMQSAKNRAEQDRLNYLRKVHIRSEVIMKGR